MGMAMAYAVSWGDEHPSLQQLMCSDGMPLRTGLETGQGWTYTAF